jgi:hypothetical protein
MKIRTHNMMISLDTEVSLLLVAPQELQTEPTIYPLSSSVTLCFEGGPHF